MLFFFTHLITYSLNSHFITAFCQVLCKRRGLQIRTNLILYLHSGVIGGMMKVLLYKVWFRHEAHREVSST